eukprot:768478-Hanusia_phi.AAC.6
MAKITTDTEMHKVDKLCMLSVICTSALLMVMTISTRSEDETPFQIWEEETLVDDILSHRLTTCRN